MGSPPGLRVAASSICWARDPRPAVLDKARDAGFRAVELLTMPEEIWAIHGDLRTFEPGLLRSELAARELNLAALHLGALWTTSEALRAALTAYARRAIVFAAELGCGLIVLGGPELGRGRGAGPFEPFLKSLETLLPDLERNNVRIGLENHHGNSIQFIEDYERIFERIPSLRLGITLDTGHFTSSRVDPASVARRFGARVIHVHIKDHIGTQSVALGAGETDNAAVVGALKAVGYTGYLSQELEVADHAQSDRLAREGLAYMNRLAAI